MSEPARFSVSVRELARFVHDRGDLGRDEPYGASAKAGQEGHRRLQERRADSYQAEVTLRATVATELVHLTVQGRVDGLWEEDGRPRIEEIKTVPRAGERSASARALHRAQALLYLHLWLLEHPAASGELHLVTYALTEDREKRHVESATAAEAEAFFRETVGPYLEWLELVTRHRRGRDAAMAELAFPHDDYRPGQRELSIAVYRTIQRGEHLLVEAPTGIGKTISTLFPALKAMGEGALDHILYLTAKTSGRAGVLEALALLDPEEAHLKAVAMAPREALCPHGAGLTGGCDPERCPVREGHNERLAAARVAGWLGGHLGPARMAALGKAHEVCPASLARELAPWVDVLVGDYNYLIAPGVALACLTERPCKRRVLLLDEAHNLVDRARDEFSPRLDQGTILHLRRRMRRVLPKLARRLDRLQKAFQEVLAQAKVAGMGLQRREAGQYHSPQAPDWEGPLRSVQEGVEAWLLEGGAIPARAGASPDAGGERPDDLPGEDGRVGGAATGGAIGGDETVRPTREAGLEAREILELYFEVAAMRRVLKAEDPGYVTLLAERNRGRRTVATLTRYCMDPAAILGKLYGLMGATVVFSATLRPAAYHARALGLREDYRSLLLPPVFPPERQLVALADRVDTRYRYREASLATVADLLLTVAAAKPGRYLACFPSYAYLEAVAELVEGALVARGLDWDLPRQRAGMPEAERAAFLAHYASRPSSAPPSAVSAPVSVPTSAPGSGLAPTEAPSANAGPGAGRTVLGLAIQGGVFGEGVDLPGDRLLGVVIVGPGLPGIGLERDLIRDHFDRAGQDGFDFAYRLPGWTRVLQTAGRVIRSATDRGVVLLVGRRFGEARYRALMPTSWRPTPIPKASNLREALRDFWHP